MCTAAQQRPLDQGCSLALDSLLNHRTTSHQTTLLHAPPILVPAIDLCIHYQDHPSLFHMAPGAGTSYWKTGFHSACFSRGCLISSCFASCEFVTWRSCMCHVDLIRAAMFSLSFALWTILMCIFSLLFGFRFLLIYLLCYCFQVSLDPPDRIPSPLQTPHPHRFVLSVRFLCCPFLFLIYVSFIYKNKILSPSCIWAQSHQFFSHVKSGFPSVISWSGDFIICLPNSASSWFNLFRSLQKIVPADTTVCFVSLSQLALLSCSVVNVD